ncbi:uncharacterized protein METZ01_LOCUS422166 [marine metagenome]|uniref:FecR protein domain-containing protein n=1 Tax=marine metagenome TaxID=408172 RepID=A0A382XE24_9ZZZZ
MLKYLVKDDMLKNTKKTVGLILKNFSFLLILFVLFANNVLRAEDVEKKFIGFVDSLEGSVNKEDVDDLIKLNAFDQIFTNDKIKIGTNSSIVVSFIDNSILTLQSDSEFLVEKFDKISEEPSFIIAITKGKFAFESGTIAKNDKGIMKVNLGEMEIDLEASAIIGSIFEKKSEVSMVPKTTGGNNPITVCAGGECITITEPHTGVEFSSEL